MLCHVCREPAIGQCRNCGLFYCAEHGRVYCITCDERTVVRRPAQRAAAARTGQGESRGALCGSRRFWLFVTVAAILALGVIGLIFLLQP
jgi:hypothetical protein